MLWVNVNLATGNASDSRIIRRNRLDAYVLEFSVRHCVPPGAITVKFSDQWTGQVVLLLGPLRGRLLLILQVDQLALVVFLVMDIAQGQKDNEDY